MKLIRRIPVRELLDLFTARLSRKVVLWIFAGIVVIEAIILIPSVRRHERSSLNQIQDLSFAKIIWIVTAYPNLTSEELLNEVEKLQRDPMTRQMIIGAAVYDGSGQLIGTSGETPVLAYADLTNLDSMDFKAADFYEPATGRYDVAWSIPHTNQQYFLIIRHNASSVSHEVSMFVLRIGGLALIISGFVTLVALIALGPTVIVPILHLQSDLLGVGEAIRYDRPVPKFKSSSIKRKDELGDVISAFQEMVDKVYQAMGDRKKAEHRLERVVRQLENASQKIQTLNHRLESENFRLSAELDITRRLQRMLLPKDYELNQLQGLDVAGFMEPADDVGGDYYDVLQHNGSIKIGIGDVTGHGLESGVLMIMTQTAVRTLLASDETDPVKFLNTLNRAIYGNLQRMDSEKSLTLSLLDYQDGVMSISGQHEEVLLVRATGKIERIDTIDLGFPIGLEAEISQFVEQIQVVLEPGDGIVLYTDGITEAENWRGDHYGLGRLCHVVQHEWYRSAADIQNSVIQDVQQFIGKHDIYDDITLLVVKRK